VFKYIGVLCGNRDIKDIIIVDNSTINYSLSISNGLPIADFKGQNEDFELPFLGKYLREIAGLDDFTKKIREDFEAFLLKETSTC